MKFILPLSICVIICLLFSCGNAKKNVITKKESPTTDYQHPRMASTDFYAISGDNSWKLTVQFHQKIVFTDTVNNIYFQADSNTVIVANDADIVHIYAKNKNKIIHVTISTIDCNKTGKRVNISIEKKDTEEVKKYDGCGIYRGLPQLHDIWAVVAVNGKKLNPQEFPKELPHFEINLVQHQITGFAGCNRVHGQIQFEYKRIIIKSLVSTRIYCKNTSKIETQILNVLRDKPTYSYKNLILRLETKEGSIKLRKVD